MSEDDERDYEAELIKTAKKSHTEIEDAIRKHMADLGITGMATGWVLLVSIVDYEEEEEPLEGLFDTHSDGLTKWAKVGLLDIALNQQRQEGWW